MTSQLSGTLADVGYVRLTDVSDALKAAHDRTCDCRIPDIWVRAGSQGNEYRCGMCLGYVTGMER